MSNYSSAFIKNGVTVICCDKCNAPHAHYIAAIDGCYCESCSVQIGEDYLEDEEEEVLETCPCCGKQAELYSYGKFQLRDPVKGSCIPCMNNGKAKNYYG